jgi:hypothetical protein
MSSNSFRDPLCGIIVQGDRVVGSICIPKDGGEFIEEFNNCYGPLRMQAAEIPDHDDTVPVTAATAGVCLLPSWISRAWRPPNVG